MSQIKVKRQFLRLSSKVTIFLMILTLTQTTKSPKIALVSLPKRWLQWINAHLILEEASLWLSIAKRITFLTMIQRRVTLKVAASLDFSQKNWINGSFKGNHQVKIKCIHKKKMRKKKVIWIHSKMKRLNNGVHS
jgi:hypothetical protein